MARGTFGNIRLVNKFIGKAAPKEGNPLTATQFQFIITIYSQRQGK